MIFLEILAIWFAACIAFAVWCTVRPPLGERRHQAKVVRLADYRLNNFPRLGAHQGRRVS